MNHQCPLCSHPKSAHFHQDKRRFYFRCEQCYLVFADRQTLIPLSQEKSIYDLHENSEHDIGYIRFLNRFCKPMLKKLTPPMQGLEFGCGPSPVLAKLLSSAGHHISLYDPFYFPERGALKQQYDFITCTEAIEHFHQPEKEWQLFLSIVKDGGWIGIMTKLVIDAEAFANWHYKNDVTHVSFFSKETFEFLAKRDHLELEFVGKDVILLKKISQA